MSGISKASACQPAGAKNARVKRSGTVAFRVVWWLAGWQALGAGVIKRAKEMEEAEV